MKILLPSLAFLLVALVVLWPQIQETQGRFRLGFAEMSPDEVGGLSMLKVRYTGVDSEDRPFTVTADSAAQADGDANRIALNRPEADITLNDDSWLALGAERGLYAQDIRILDLEGAVNLFHDQGYEITTERARVDLAAGTAVGDRPVRGHGPFGEFEAAGFYILDQGATVFLGGRARLKLYLKGEEGR
ncbi:MAG: LPS export ABC transporter periplasmic protein LptC [Proteobacteria bacterium]|nr:LPS export ABC transporter periplasmic protein LptC [Pseudomonadota bacterium]